jgi:hypothetical protein
VAWDAACAPHSLCCFGFSRQWPFWLVLMCLLTCWLRTVLRADQQRLWRTDVALHAAGSCSSE